MNTIVAESLDFCATKLEKATGGDPTKLNGAIQALLTEITTECEPIIFNGDGYSEAWHKEAAKRGLLNLKTTCDALPMLVKKEVDILRTLTVTPQRPYVVVLGGAKVADKLAVIENLMKTADRLLIGGGMAFTFLAAEGYEVGSSLLDKDNIETCKGYLARAKESGVEIILPVDVVAATAFSADAEHDVVPADGIPADRMGLDIGPRSAELYASKVRDAKTVFWNGPMGAFEMAP